MGLFGNKNKSEDDEIRLGSGVSHGKVKNLLDRDTLKKKLAPDGINPNSLDHLYICDMGHDCYIRSFYIEEVPRNVHFASTFAPLFNFKRLVSSVFINPMIEGEATKLIEKKIRSDETELIAAEKDGDSNRIRKLQNILRRDEEWATGLENGNDRWFKVGFLFTLTRDTLEQLNLASSDLVSIAKEKNIELCSCYGMQQEAFLSSGPYNKVYDGVFTVFKSSPVKTHIFDTEALATIFNHTNTFFSHPTGIPAGRNMGTGEPVLWDPYAKSHQGYSAVFVGKTGTGKSCTIKLFARRLEHFGYRFACIDTEKTAGQGEYAPLCEAMGGINFEIKTTSSNKLNIFEVDEQLERDSRIGREVRTLKLADKISDVRHILLTAITVGKREPDFELMVAMEKILSECLVRLYSAHGIIDGDPDSLYVDAARKVRKPLPVMSELFLLLLQGDSVNTIEEHDHAYQILIDALSDLVDELYVDVNTLSAVTREDYIIAQNAGRGDEVYRIHGTKGYFDGQSSVHVDRTVPFINIDISDLPKDDKLLGQQVAMNFLMENFIKKNSEDKDNAQKIVMIVDEAHRMFPYPQSRSFLADQVRTARKNNASMWICTQNHSDFAVSEETKGMLKNIASIFMLKQDASDRKYLKENTILTDSAITKVISLGGDPNEVEDKSHKGEVLLIDSDKTVFLKVDYLKRTEKVFAETGDMNYRNEDREE